MAEHLQAEQAHVSAGEFLAALELSGVLADAKWREVQDRFALRMGVEGPLAMAHELVHEGTLTKFQARRLLIGKKGLTFGRYTLLDQVGRGSRGHVYKARHRLMDRLVALKVYRPTDELSGTSLSRFFREMKIVGMLDHRNVVRAIDADVHEGCPYIVMEYLDGTDLDQVLVRRGPLPPEEVIDDMAQALRGLAHAHEKGVIHRDVKPTNLFLVNTGIVKVLDLGMGELVGMTGLPGNIFDTDEGIVVGTTDFIAPEQVKDEPIDARADLFSVGCTMYRLLTGTYAFPGDTREHRLVKRIREPHVPITHVRPDLSPRLIAIIDRLLAARPEDRFDSAALAAEALEALIPQAGRSEGDPSAGTGGTGPRADAVTLTVKPDAMPDWSSVESALRPTAHGSREGPRLVERHEPKPPSAKDLSHRKILEEEGVESGRQAHELYRGELIQMKRVMAELRSMKPNDEVPPEGPTWLERIGEKFGDFLAEPSAGQIVIAILLVVLVLTLVLVLSLG
jgi:serine/threonine-protein kinase